MTDSLKNLGQSKPASNTLTPLYTVPAIIGTAASTLFVCNESSTADYFYVSVAVNGATDTPAQYIYYNLFLDSNDTFIATVGLSLAPGDIVRIMSVNGNIAFSLFGVEVS